MIGPILDGMPRLRYTPTSATVSVSGTSLVQRMSVTKLASLAPINGQFTIYNAGVNGQMIDGMRSNAATKEDTQFDPAKVNIIVAWGATNTIWGFNKTGATAFAEMTSYCQERLAAHPKVKIILATEIPRIELNNYTQAECDARNAQLDAYNALVRTNYKAAGAVGVADLRGGSSPFNLANYSLSSFTAIDSLWDTADGATYRVHLSSAGYDVVYPVIAAALKRLPPR